MQASTQLQDAQSGRHDFPPLESLTQPAVTTAAAAHYLSRAPNTLRGWASTGNGPIKPLRIHGRLAWRTGDLRSLLGVA
jgi:hypothetical protein